MIRRPRCWLYGASLFALAGISGFNLVACTTPGDTGLGADMMPGADMTPAGPMSHSYNLNTGSGQSATITIDASNVLTMTFSIDTASPVVTYHISGTCGSPSSVYGTQLCTISTSDETTTFVPNTQLKFKEVPGIAMMMGYKKPTDSLPAVPADVIQQAAALWEVAGDCESLHDDYATFGQSNVDVPFSVTRMDFSVPSYVHSDFGLAAASSNFTSVAEPTAAASGAESVSSPICTGGVWKYSITPPGGTAQTAFAFATPSGIVVDSMRGTSVPKSLAITNLNSIASKTFAGAIAGRSSQLVDLFTLSMGTRSANSVSAATYDSATGSPALQGLELLLAADPAASAAFSVPAPAANSLAAAYPTAAQTPGLLFSPERNAAGDEQPRLMVAFKSKLNGKLAIFGVNSNRSGTNFKVDSLTIAVEQ